MGNEMKLNSGARATASLGERGAEGWIRISGSEDGLSITVVSSGERSTLYADDPRAILRLLQAVVDELDRVKALFHPREDTPDGRDEASA